MNFLIICCLLNNLIIETDVKRPIRFDDENCIIKNNIFDTICHEHLGFFSSKVIMDMMRHNGLKVFNHEYNNINGGSSRYYICHKKADYKTKKSNIILLEYNIINCNFNQIRSK